MSRSSHHLRQMQLQQQQQQQQQMADNDAAALAAEMFDHFCIATTMRQVLGLYRNMCDTVGLRPSPLNEFYPKLKAKIRNWKAAALWKKFDARASHRVYNKGNACNGTRVLVIGAGPCGLRTAIEAQLLGAKVVVIEKRDRISRNNVLHLWPFVITDLRNLGAKKFYGKFCAGSIDHISIRQLQCVLLKVALLLGVEIHEGVSFINTIEPCDGYGWRAQVSPEDHAVSHYEFDVLIGADGKRNTLEGFKRKEFRGKLAIAITANFINKKTEAEAKVEEISGVAFIFNQSFFKELYQTTGIDLENIVYYKDETHYFVMTAKKHSLIDKGVIIQDFADPAELLSPVNVNTEKLLDYAREAAEFSTKYQMPNLEFAVNHYGKPDVAMFDFTSMFAAEASCRVLVRKNYRLLQCLVGDSLLEPFWPTGSGCARGFLSSMDAAYAVKLWSNPKNSILGVLAQRESIYRLLAQTTPENLQRDIGAYTLDPASRYPNLNKATVNVWQVKNLLDTDDKQLLEQTHMDTSIAQGAISETPVRRKRRSGDTLPLSAILLRWIKAQLHAYEFTQHLNEVSDVFTNGKVLVALINRYRPDLVDLSTTKDWGPKERNELAFKILENEMGIPRVMSSKDSLTLENIESKIWLNYLEQICEVFRGEIPHVKHPKLDLSEFQPKVTTAKVPDFSNLLQIGTRKAKSPLQDIDMTTNVIHRRSVLDEDKLRKQRKFTAAPTTEYSPSPVDTTRRAKKRRSHEKSGTIEERQQRLQEIEANRQERQNRRKLQRYQQTQNFYKSLQMLHANTLLRQSDSSSPFEDYSIYLYRQQAPEFNDRVKDLERKLLYPDRERGIQSALPRGTDEQFSDRIKSMEQRITSNKNYGAEKKPKDLLRAIGKLESNDWNVREIEKKIEQSKKTEIMGKNREKVPKWSKEQFLARQNKMAKPVDRQESVDEKFKEIDQTIKNLDKQLRGDLEIGERGKNKVASIAGQFIKKDDTSEEKSIPIPKSIKTSKVGLVFNKQSKTEKCHFCKQTVYLMERISAENLILHRSCLKCHHCHTNLRLGGYAFDRDDPIGKFYCTQHYRLPAKEVRPIVRRSRNQKKPSTEENQNQTDKNLQTPVRGRPGDVAQLDLLDRGQTPERIEFENIDAMSDGEPSLENVIDENEWTDRNFITGDEDEESDLSSSDSSDESDSDMFEEANGSPIGAQTLQLANDWIGKQKYSNVTDSDDEDDFYDSSEGLLEDDADSQTEGEEFKKAREMRRQEVKVLPPPSYLPTDTETEVMTKDVTQTNDNINTNFTDNTDDNMTKTNDTDTKQIDKKSISDIDKLNNNNNIKPDIIESIDNKSDEKNKNEIPSKIEIKTIERNLGRQVSNEIDNLNENLYNLNNLIKLNKEIENVQRDNLVRNDIMKKLSLKEKWLNEMYGSGSGSDSGKSMGFQISSNVAAGQSVVNDKKSEVEKIAENVEKIAIENENINKKVEKEMPKEDIKEEIKNVEKENDKVAEKRQKIEEESKNVEKEKQKPKEQKTEEEKPKETENQQISKKSTISDTPAAIKRSKLKKSQSEYVQNENEMTELEMKRLSITGKSIDKDIGKLLYDVENKSEKKLDEKIKNIEVKNFADTMDTIKSQMQTPKVSKQSSFDLSKYFPNQKQEKAAPVATNKNQKNLKDVDLTKYFSQSPVNQRKSNNSSATQSPAMNRKSEQVQEINKPIIEKLTQSSTKITENKIIEKPKPRQNVFQAKPTPNILNRPIPKKNTLDDVNQKTVEKKLTNIAGKSGSKASLKKQESSDSDLFDQLLDGAVDLKKSPVVTKKTSVTGKQTGQKKVTGSKTKKKAKDTKAGKQKSTKVLTEEEKKFEEILHTDENGNEESPSKEYRELFHDEKSPSTDVSDKIEKIFKNEKVDLGSGSSRKRKGSKDNNTLQEKEPENVPHQGITRSIVSQVVKEINKLLPKFEKVDESSVKMRKKDDTSKPTTPLSKRNSITELLKYTSEGSKRNSMAELLKSSPSGSRTNSITDLLKSTSPGSRKNSLAEPTKSTASGSKRNSITESLKSTPPESRKNSIPKPTKTTPPETKINLSKSSPSNSKRNSLTESLKLTPSGSKRNSITESLKSTPPESNRNSMTDLEKTMEYLKTEWRSEATNFLQAKRDSFNAKRKSSSREDERSENITEGASKKDETSKKKEENKNEESVVPQEKRSRSESQILEIEMDVDDDEIDSFLNQIMEEMKDDNDKSKKENKPKKIEEKISVESPSTKSQNETEESKVDSEHVKKKSPEQNLLLSNPFIDIIEEPPTLVLPSPTEESVNNLATGGIPQKTSSVSETFLTVKNTSRRRRASSSDSIEELFKGLTDDMLVDVEFDSDGEIISITPREKSEEESSEEEEEESEKESKLQFFREEVKNEEEMNLKNEELEKSVEKFESKRSDENSPKNLLEDNVEGELELKLKDSQEDLENEKGKRMSSVDSKNSEKEKSSEVTANKRSSESGSKNLTEAVIEKRGSESELQIVQKNLKNEEEKRLSSVSSQNSYTEKSNEGFEDRRSNESNTKNVLEEELEKTESEFKLQSVQENVESGEEKRMSSVDSQNSEQEKSSEEVANKRISKNGSKDFLEEVSEKNESEFELQNFQENLGKEVEKRMSSVDSQNSEQEKSSEEVANKRISKNGSKDFFEKVSEKNESEFELQNFQENLKSEVKKRMSSVDSEISEKSKPDEVVLSRRSNESNSKSVERDGSEGREVTETEKVELKSENQHDEGIPSMGLKKIDSEEFIEESRSNKRSISGSNESSPKAFKTDNSDESLENRINFENEKNKSFGEVSVRRSKSTSSSDKENQSSEFLPKKVKEEMSNILDKSEELNTQKNNNEVVNMGISYRTSDSVENSGEYFNDNNQDQDMKIGDELITSEPEKLLIENPIEVENEVVQLKENTPISEKQSSPEIKIDEKVNIQSKQKQSVDKQENLKEKDKTVSNGNKNIHFCTHLPDESNPKCFPRKPLRRQKSVSSSTSPEHSVTPQRDQCSRERSLSRLNPEDMPPSVQDILKKIDNTDDAYFVGLNDENPTKFPTRYEDKGSPVNGEPETNISHSKMQESVEILNENEKNMTEEEYIEELEKERRKSLIRRDEMYAKQNAMNPLVLTTKERPKSVVEEIERNGLQETSKLSSPPKVPPRSPKPKRRLNREKQNSNEETFPNSYSQQSLEKFDSSSRSLSKSIESIPHRPQRTKGNSHQKLDPGTDILLERSRMLHSLKEDFINDKMITGNNPYLKKKTQYNRTQSSDEDDDTSYHDAINTSMNREQRYNTLHFPTSRTIDDRRRRKSKTPEYTGVNRRFANLSNALGGSRNFVDYFKRSPSQPKERIEQTRDSCVQTDSESSPDNVELNSATEISTDSEFDHDPIIRETPRIFIDDTHIKKPTKVQVKQGIVTSSPTRKVPTSGNHYHHHHHHQHNNHNNQQSPIIKEPPQLEFKPLVQVDPSLLNSNRLPLKNPRPGDYLLNKTPSTEGIASKKSLELKKRYLLGEQGIGNGIMKSGSTSILDSKMKSFYSNISECQKLLHPGADISPGMKTFLDKTKVGDLNKNNNTTCNTGGNGSGSSSFMTKSSITAAELEKKDSEKENFYVNNRNELNKSATTSAILTNNTGIGLSNIKNINSSNIGEYSETINTALVENISKTITKSTILETIDLISPEKSVPLIDLTKIDIPSEMIKSNKNFIKNIKMGNDNENKINDDNDDDNEIIDLTHDDTPIKNEDINDVCDEKPDVSKDVKETIPDIITHIENVKNEKRSQQQENEEKEIIQQQSQQQQQQKDNDIQETCIEVPNIPWNNRKTTKTNGDSDVESDSLSNSSTSSSLDDIPHYILDSTTSPDTQNIGCGGIEQIVPRLEIHDSSGALMQIDSLMIIDGKYIGDPEDLKLMEIPEGTKIELPTPPKTPENNLGDEIKDKEDKENEKLSDKDSTPTNKPRIIEQSDITATTITPTKSQLENDDENLTIISTRTTITTTKPNLKFDTKNENKIDTLKNMPFVIENDENKIKMNKPTTLDLNLTTISNNNKTKLLETTNLNDKDKTPTAERSCSGGGGGISDSETEITGQVLTETELSDWTADDAVSENFVDIEFALNSNKGTIKRNKKGKKRMISTAISSSKLKTPTSTSQQQQQQQQKQRNEKSIKTPIIIQTPTKDCGILKNLDIEEIEFMDTGSEGSCAETYSATNRAMLMNRGYIQFIENNASNLLPNNRNLNMKDSILLPSSNSGKEILGIDYIEQGACILNNDYDLKTPVNETPPPPPPPTTSSSSFSSTKQRQQSLQSQQQSSTTDNVNDIDEDSLQYLTSQGTTDLYTTTTTEESEALTVVTSPLESINKFSLPDNTTTPSSSSDKQDKTTTTTSNTTASSKVPIRKLSSSDRRSIDEGKTTTTTTSSSKQSSHEDLFGNKNKDIDEMSYEEYVRKLQMKITQISNARDSIDIRKQKRKSSKSDPLGSTIIVGNCNENTQNNTVIDNNKSLSIFEPNRSLTTLTITPTTMSSTMTASNNSLSSVQQQLLQQQQQQQQQKTQNTEVPTLSRKLEEITKERTKQKDLIHDLVMDKLQSKKQLNAEKRLNRSRNRNLFSPSHAITSPPPKVPVPNLSSTNNICSNSPHYHVPSSSERRNSKEILIAQQQQQQNTSNKIKSSPKENKDIAQMFTTQQQYQHQRSSKQQRPLSDNLEIVSTTFIFDQTPKITKTQSFCVYTPKTSSSFIRDESLKKKYEIDNDSIFTTPLPPPRTNRKYDETLSASRDKLRAEARARARLKSNEELGLSPEEKFQMLRKRYHLDLHELSSTSTTSGLAVSSTPITTTASAATTPIESLNKSDDIKLRERKMITSKSVNDISLVQSNLTSDENLNKKSPRRGDLVDFTSDPNLSSQQHQQQQHHNDEDNIEKTSIKNRRRKDPERRKSLIQTVSSFFNKKKDKDSSLSPQSPTKEKSSESVFSRFRISPKSKEKSKDKDLMQSSDGTRSSSHDCLEHNLTTTTAGVGETSGKTYSSSPQLFKRSDDTAPPPIPPLPTNYQRSDDESYTAEPREQKKQRAISKASRQAELKRLRIAQEIQREQEEIEVKLKELEAKGVLIEKTLRGEGQNMENLDSSTMGASDEKLLKELLEIWRNITQLKKRDEELAIQQQELQLEHRHAQLREELDMRLSCSKLDKSSADVAAEGAILNEMLEIVAKRAALRPTETITVDQQQNENDDSDI